MPRPVPVLKEEQITLPEIGACRIRALLLTERWELLKATENDQSLMMPMLLAKTVYEANKEEQVYDAHGWNAYGASYTEHMVDAFNKSMVLSGLNGEVQEKN